MIKKRFPVQVVCVASFPGFGTTNIIIILFFGSKKLAFALFFYMNKERFFLSFLVKKVDCCGPHFLLFRRKNAASLADFTSSLLLSLVWRHSRSHRIMESELDLDRLKGDPLLLELFRHQIMSCMCCATNSMATANKWAFNQTDLTSLNSIKYL